MKKLLVVEDNQQLQVLLKQSLAGQYSVTQAYSLAAAYQNLETTKFELVMIDRVLPDGDGIELIEYLADYSYPTKVLALTTKADVQDRVQGLESGADDYLAKPFNLGELKLRIQKLFNMEKQVVTEKLTLGKLEFDPTTGSIRISDSKLVQLRKRESQILYCLIRYKNQVVTRQMLVDTVWAGEVEYPAISTLDVYVRRLRVILKEYSRHIKTIRGFGYMASDG